MIYTVVSVLSRYDHEDFWPLNEAARSAGLTMLDVSDDTYALVAALLLGFVTERMNCKGRMYGPDPQIVLVYYLKDASACDGDDGGGVGSDEGFWD